MTLNIILGIFIAFLAIRGWRKGLIGEIVETAGVFVAVLATVRVYPKLEDLFGLESPWGRIFVAAIIFIGIMIVLTLIGKGLRALMEKASLGTAEKTLGFLFGAIKAGLIIAVLSAVLLRAGADGKKIVSESLLTRTNMRVFAWITNVLPDEWGDKVDAALPDM